MRIRFLFLVVSIFAFTALNSGAVDIPTNEIQQAVKANVATPEMLEIWGNYIAELEQNGDQPGRDQRGDLDDANYYWKDSNEEDGPEFGWIDISGIGVNLNAGDDWNSDILDLGFEFEWYGATYSEIYICSNGWASFVSDGYSIFLPRAPDEGEPNSILLVNNDDFSADEEDAHIYFWADPDGGTVVVTWDNVHFWNDVEIRSSFQMILMSDGSVTYQYGPQTGVDGSNQNVGFESSDGLLGSSIIYREEGRIEEGLAIRIVKGLAVISIDPQELVSDNGGQYELTIGNSGDGLLDWEVEIEQIAGEFDHGILGEVLNTFQWQWAGQNYYKNGFAWDRDENRMWVCGYNHNFVGTIDPNDNFTQGIHYNYGQGMSDMAWLNGLVYIIYQTNGVIQRFNSHGQLMESIYLPDNFNPSAIATDSENNLFFAVNRYNFSELRVYSVSDEGDFEQIGTINNYLPMVDNNQVWNIEWVPEHQNGELWVHAYNHIYQVDIDTDNWSAVELVQDYSPWNDGHGADGIGFDGENLWIGSYSHAEYQIVNDATPEESPWLSLNSDYGTVGPGQSDQVNLTIHSGDMIDYRYEANLHFNSNDEENSDVVVNVILSLPPPEIVVDPVEFQVSRYAEEVITISNAGEGNLKWDTDIEYPNGLENTRAYFPNPEAPLPGRFALFYQSHPWRYDLQNLISNSLPEDALDVFVSMDDDYNLNDYDVIWIANDQSSHWNTIYNNHIAEIEEWVAGGGILYHCTGNSWTGVVPVHPGGLSPSWGNSNGYALSAVSEDENYFVEIMDWYQGHEVTYQSSAYYSVDDLNEIDNSDDYQIMMVQENAELPLVATYNYGSGWVVVSGMKDGYLQNYVNNYLWGSTCDELLDYMSFLAHNKYYNRSRGGQNPWVSWSPRSGVVEGNALAEIEIIIDPLYQAESVHEAILHILSNDPENADIEVDIILSIIPVEITVDPLEFEGVGEHTVTIGNVGEGLLRWNTEIEIVRNVEGRDGIDRQVRQTGQHNAVDEDENQAPDRDMFNEVQGFGYSWIDSDERYGPEYEWIDITSMGSRYLNNVGDDWNSGWIDMEMEFPWYNETYNRFRILADGGITFDDFDGTHLGTIPSPTEPNSSFSLFAYDLDPTQGGSIFYLLERDRTIVSWEAVKLDYQDVNPPDYMRFQVIFNADGSVKYQFFNVENRYYNNGQTTIWSRGSNFGFESPNGSAGALRGRSRNNYAVLIERDYDELNWVSVSPESGIVDPGEQVEMLVTINSDYLHAGFHQANVHILSNDTNDEDDVVISISVEVEGIPQFTTNHEAPDFGNVRIDGDTAEIDVTITNSGSDVGVLESVSLEGDGFSAEFGDIRRSLSNNQSFTLPAISFDPEELRNYEGTLTITYSHPGDGEFNGELVLNLLGFGQGNPEIRVEPENIDAEGSGEHNITIHNDSDHNLTWWTTLETVSDGRDGGQRQVRQIEGGAPRRDEKGDVIEHFNWARAGAYDYRAGITWDRDQRLMWLTSYNTIGAVDPDDNYREVFAFQPNNTYQMDATWLNGTLYTYSSHSRAIFAYDMEGNELGEVVLPNNWEGTALASDNYRNLLFVVYGPNNDVILVLSVDEDRNLEHIGSISDYRYYIGDYDIRNIEWVPEHTDGELWVHYFNPQQNSRNNIIRQIDIDTESWETIGLASTMVFRDESGGTGTYNDWDGIGHDGENIWISRFEHNDYFIIDDGQDETPGWLTYTPDEGVVSGGESAAITLSLDATDLEFGFYEANLHINSDDQENSEVVINVLMSIIAHPSIETQPEFLDFGDVQTGDTGILTLIISNSGVADLNVSDISIAGDSFSCDFAGEFSVGVDESSEITVSLDPANFDNYNGTLTISSNDPVLGEMTVDLIGMGVGPTNFAIEPMEISTTESGENILTITNDGASDLTWWKSDIVEIVDEERDQNRRTVRSIGDENIEGPERDSAGETLDLFDWEVPGSNVYGGSWDRDNGWMWVTADNARRVSAIDPDDDYNEATFFQTPNGASPRSIAWMDGILYVIESQYYIQRYNTNGDSLGRIALPEGMRIESNTRITSDNKNNFLILGNRTYQNGNWTTGIHIFDPDEEGNLEQVAYFEIPNIYFFAIEWVSEHPSGELWLRMGDNILQVDIDVRNWEAVGIVQDIEINNARHVFGHDTENMWSGHNNNGSDIIIFDDGTDEVWFVSVSPEQGTVTPGENEEIALNINTFGAEVGIHEYDVIFGSNDPENEQIAVRVTVDVASEAIISVNHNSLDFGDVMVGENNVLTLEIANDGNEDLIISDIAIEGAGFNSDFNGEFTVQPLRFSDLTITFEPAEAGVFDGTMTITSNDETNGEVVIDLSGVGLSPAAIAFEPEAFDINGSSRHELVISNEGGFDLEWQVEVVGIAREDRQMGVIDDNQIDDDQNPAPRRDGLGERLAAYRWYRCGYNDYKGGIAWDSNNEWIWMTNYSNNYIGAVDPNNNYNEVRAFQPNPGQFMDITWLNGVLYAC